MTTGHTAVECNAEDETFLQASSAPRRFCLYSASSATSASPDRAMAMSSWKKGAHTSTGDGPSIPLLAYDLVNSSKPRSSSIRILLAMYGFVISTTDSLLRLLDQSEDCCIHQWGTCACTRELTVRARKATVVTSMSLISVDDWIMTHLRVGAVCCEMDRMDVPRPLPEHRANGCADRRGP